MANGQQLPLHALVRNHILDQIRSGRLAVGDQAPTEKEICEQFSVSRTTARQAYAELARLGYIVRRKGSGSFVSRPLADDAAKPRRETPTKKAIAVVLEALSDGLMPALVAAIEKHLKNNGYDMLLCNSQSRATNVLEHFERLDPEYVAGVLYRPVVSVLDIQADNRRLISLLEQKGLPFLCVDMGLPGSGWATVASDNRQGMLDITRHLIETGHERIACIHDQNDPNQMIRLDAYCQALHDAGLPAPPEYIQMTRGLPGRAVHTLLHGPKPPTALVVTHDLLALEVLKALRESGLQVPEDISVTGFDDLEVLRYAHPLLTTVRQDVDEMGRQSVENLLIAARTGEKPRSATIPATLIKRESVAPPDPGRAAERRRQLMDRLVAERA